MYAEKKGLDLQSVEVQLSHERVYAQDCAECATRDVMLDEISSQIHLEGNLTESARNRLLEIATRCPVHRTLSAQLKIRSGLI